MSETPRYHCQVWLGGWDLVDVTVDARNETEAKKKARAYVRDWLRQWTGKKGKRLPKGTTVCIIPPNYYDEIVENNKKIGIDITNW